jgi:hypothetical protein
MEYTLLTNTWGSAFACVALCLVYPKRSSPMRSGSHFNKCKNTKKAGTASRKPPATYLPDIAGAGSVLLRRSTAGARPAPCTNRRPISTIRIRLSRHAGWAPSHQSFHADSRRKASACDRQFSGADRRPRGSVIREARNSWRPEPARAMSRSWHPARFEGPFRRQRDPGLDSDALRTFNRARK